MKKRIISIALTFVMLLAMIPSVSVGATTAATYDWYDGQTEYVLDSVGDLLGFANIVNGADGKTADTFAEKTVKLGGDINMAGESWTPINGFAGTFDGNEKTISNLTYNDSTQINSYYCFGFFASCSGATVQNLTLDTVSVSRETSTVEFIYVGGLVAQVAGEFTATNVTVNSLNITLNYTGNGIKKETAIGGIVGCVASDFDAVSLTNCDVTNLNITVSAKQTTQGMGVGGLVGRSQGDILASNCDVEGNIKATKSARWYIGGFCGRSLGTVESYNNCSARINIDGSDSDNSYAKPAVVGGFVGNEGVATATYIDCSFVGELSGSFVGGCAGTMSGTPEITLDSCSFDADVVVKYEGNTGTGAGLFAKAPSLAVMNNVTVTGSVTGDETLLELYPSELFTASSAVHVAKDTGYFAQTKYDETDGLNVRLVNSISTTDGVDKLGYVTVLKYTNADGENEIKIMSGDTDKVYTGITAAGIEKTATDLGGEYIYIAEIPGYKGTSNLTVEVTPYYINSDGNTVYATTATYLLSSEGSALAGSDTVEKKTA
ncbi:MAG: hypothetical protein IKJ00_01100 [Clostridia bacterium]|nr:hypothetical protein [Clostridia bacterium]